jgi:uncharacterized membrane protein
MFNLKLLIISAIVFVFIDSAYLYLIKNYFANQIKIVQGSPMKINLTATLICYLILIFGINYFIIQSNRSVQDAFLLGLLIYGVFETTNMALFTKWAWLTVLMDTLWGGVLFALTTSIVKVIKY